MEFENAVHRVDAIVDDHHHPNGDYDDRRCCNKQPAQFFVNIP